MVRGRVRRVLVAIVVTVFALAGCAQPGDLAGPTGPGPAFAADTPAAAGLGEPCDAQADAAQTPVEVVPADAVLVRVTRCVFVAQAVPGAGEWLVRHDQEATSGLAALADALRLPSQAPAQACRAIGYAPIVVTLTAATGREFQPLFPHDGCGAPLTAATEALAALPWTTTATTPLSRLRTELSMTSGCSDDWKHMIDITAAEGSGTSASTVDTTARPLKVCWYDVSTDPADALDMGGVLVYGGQLVAASTMEPEFAQQLLQSLHEAPRATGPCEQSGQPFAIIQGLDGGPWHALELGGCYRVLVDGENYLRQLHVSTLTWLE